MARIAVDVGQSGSRSLAVDVGQSGSRSLAVDADGTRRGRTGGYWSDAIASVILTAVRAVAAPGEHWVANSLAVMAAVRAAGGDLGAAGIALGQMAGLAGRGARIEIPVEGGEALLIDESYNANPASMRATLAQLGKTAARRRIAVLGAMKELGEHGPGFHAALAKPLAEAHVDFAILVGDEMKALADELGKSGAGALGKPLRFAHCQNPAEARQALADFGVGSGDAILVKGSNSVGLGALVAALAAKEG